MDKWKKIFIIMMVLFLITGCWDKIEIDKRIFVTLMGVDKFEENKERKKSKPGEAREPKKTPRNRYTLTFGYPNVGVIAGKGEGEPKYKYISTGQTMFSIRQDVATRLSSNLFFNHMKGVVLGEKLAWNPLLMREVLDILERSPEVSRRLYLLITPGNAKDIFNTSPKDEPVLGLAIRDMMQQNITRIPDADFGYILKGLHESNAAIIPRIISSEDEFKIAGSAVLKDFKMIGWLGEIETDMVMYMLDRVRMDNLNVKVNDLLLSLQISNSKTDMKVLNENGEIVTTFKIEAEANLLQHLFEVKGDTLENSYIKKVEMEASKKLENQILNTYKKMQKEFNVDLAQVGEYLRKHDPDTWNKVKKDWDEVFPNTKVRVNVDIKLRRIGITR